MAIDFTFNPSQETAAQYTARTQQAIAANNPGDPNNARLSTLSGTNATPIQGNPSASPTVNIPQSTGNPMLDFQNALAAIDAAAKQQRNQFAPTIASSLPAVNAQDFGGIVKMLNSAGDQYASTVQKNAIDAYKSNQPSYDTVSVGGDLYQVQKDASGQIVGQPTLLIKNPNPSSGTKDLSGDWSAAQQFVSSNPNASRSELEAGIRQHTKLSTADISSLLDSAGAVNETINLTGNEGAFAKGLVDSLGSVEAATQYVSSGQPVTINSGGKSVTTTLSRRQVAAIKASLDQIAAKQAQQPTGFTPQNAWNPLQQ